MGNRRYYPRKDEKMKHFKKVMALLLAAVMVLAMGTTALAADPDYSITVNNAKEGETYTAYKMLDLSVDDPTNPTAYRYTVNSAWSAFANTAEFKAVYTVDPDLGYVTSVEQSEPAWSPTSALSLLGEKAAAYAKANSIPVAGSVTIDPGADTGIIHLNGPGYYVVSSTLGTRAMIETTPSKNKVEINEKNDVDTIEKSVQEDSSQAWGTQNDAQIGDTVHFKSVVKIVPRSVNVFVHDKMDDGLTFSGNSDIKLFTDEACTTPLPADKYTIKTTPDTGDTFTIEIDDSFAAATTEDAYIFITYSAVLNKKAISDTPGIVGQLNKTHVSFGDETESTEVTTTTITHKFEVFKHAKDSEDHLADAVFALKKGDAVVNLIKIDATNYRVADATERTGQAQSHANNGEINPINPGTLVSDFVTVASGNIVIWGVDDDDDYKLEEIQAPKGYNKLKNTVSIDVKADDTSVVDVENETGAELPSTGGIGTTIFYVVGAVLVIGAGVLLVSRRRMR